MALADEAEYEITAPLCGSFDSLQAALKGFNTAEECMFLRRTPKKTREIEVRQYMHGDVRAEETADGSVRLTMAIRITPGGSVKPQEVLSLLCERYALPVHPDGASVHRLALLGGGKGLLSEGAGEVRS